jgi:hypothetical protein
MRRNTESFQQPIGDSGKVPFIGDRRVMKPVDQTRDLPCDLVHIAKSGIAGPIEAESCGRIVVGETKETAPIAIIC